MSPIENRRWIAVDALTERSEYVARSRTIQSKRVCIGGLTPDASRPKQVRKPASAELRIELRDIEPLIWRRIIVPTSWPMSTLHHYVQSVMGWQDSHAHEFRIGGQIIAPEWWLKEISLDRDTGNDRDERRVKVATMVSGAAAARTECVGWAATARQLVIDGHEPLRSQRRGDRNT